MKGKKKMKMPLSDFLSMILKIIIILWLISFSKQLGIKPEEIGQAVKNFNASFGPKLPDANREKKK